MTNIPELKTWHHLWSRAASPSPLSSAAATPWRPGEGCTVSHLRGDETDAARAVADVRAAGVNALCVFLGTSARDATMIADCLTARHIHLSAAEGTATCMTAAATPTAACSTPLYNLGLRGKPEYHPRLSLRHR